MMLVHVLSPKSSLLFVCKTVAILLNTLSKVKSELGQVHKMYLHILL